MLSASFMFLHDSNEPHIPISEAIVPFDSNIYQYLCRNCAFSKSLRSKQ